MATRRNAARIIRRLEQENAPTRAILRLRGRALAEETARLVALRAQGHACTRCARLLGPGGTCPDHPPPRRRQARQAPGRSGW